MKKFHLLLGSSLLFLALTVGAKAQSSSSQSSSYSQSVSSPVSNFARRSINFDLLGNKRLIGSSFEYRFGKSINGFGIRAGLGFAFGYTATSFSYQDPFNPNAQVYNSFNSEGAQAILFPIEANYLFFKRNHHLELGAGLTPFFYANQKASFSSRLNEEKFGFSHSGNVTVAYRYQRPSGGFNLRIGVSPSFRLLSSWAITSPPLYPFLSVGYSF